MSLEQTQKQIVDHLHRLPEEFKQACKDGAYARAALDYEYTLLISKSIGMDHAKRAELLAQYNQKEVEDAFKKCGRWEDVKRITDRKEAV